MYLSLFVGVLYCFGMNYWLSFLIFNHLDAKKRACPLAFIVYWMPWYCKCPVAHPHEDVGWSAVCESGKT